MKKLFLHCIFLSSSLFGDAAIPGMPSQGVPGQFFSGEGETLSTQAYLRGLGHTKEGPKRQYILRFGKLNRIPAKIGLSFSGTLMSPPRIAGRKGSGLSTYEAPNLNRQGVLNLARSRTPIVSGTLSMKTKDSQGNDVVYHLLFTGSHVSYGVSWGEPTRLTCTAPRCLLEIDMQKALPGYAKIGDVRLIPVGRTGRRQIEKHIRYGVPGDPVHPPTMSKKKDPFFSG